MHRRAGRSSEQARRPRYFRVSWPRRAGSRPRNMGALTEYFIGPRISGARRCGRRDPSETPCRVCARRGRSAIGCTLSCCPTDAVWLRRTELVDRRGATCLSGARDVCELRSQHRRSGSGEWAVFRWRIDFWNTGTSMSLAPTWEVGFFVLGFEESLDPSRDCL